MKTEQLVIDPEKVRKAAASCPTASDVLKTLFPDAFKEKDNGIDLMKLTGGPHLLGGTKWLEAGFDGRGHGPIQVRIGGELAGKSFFLSSYLNWEIKKDTCGLSCLIPTRK